jgi:hypothetical protein
VVDRFFEKDSHVVVMEGVDDSLALTLADDEAEVTQYAQLVRDGGLLHRHFRCELAD